MIKRTHKWWQGRSAQGLIYPLTRRYTYKTAGQPRSTTYQNESLDTLPVLHLSLIRYRLCDVIIHFLTLTRWRGRRASASYFIMGFPGSSHHYYVFSLFNLVFVLFQSLLLLLIFSCIFHYHVINTYITFILSVNIP
jgi:hypothetical protein